MQKKDYGVVKAHQTTSTINQYTVNLHTFMVRKQYRAEINIMLLYMEVRTTTSNSVQHTAN
jgi:hypothetical protein